MTQKINASSFHRTLLCLLAVVYGAFLTACSALEPVAMSRPSAVYPSASPSGPYAPAAPAPMVVPAAPPPPVASAPPLAAHAAPAPGAKDKLNDENVLTIKTFFGTDRKRTASAIPGQKWGNDDSVLKYGIAEVTIPLKTHQPGKIERTPWFRPEDARFDMLVKTADDIPKDRFIELLRQRNRDSSAKSAFIFIHGYNTSFEDAALRTAQIANDLDLVSIPAFYSWASQGRMHKYTYDEANIERTEPKLEEFLTVFADNVQVKEIFVVAHSMGTRAVTRALARALAKRPDLQPKFAELILAAPDIDAQVFETQLLQPLRAVKQKVTLYVSNNDKALWASRALHQHLRAGEVGPMLSGDDIETIDASGVDTDFLGHSYFAQTQPLLGDLYQLLNGRMRASARKQLDAKEADGVRYWQIRPNLTANR